MIFKVQLYTDKGDIVLSQTFHALQEFRWSAGMQPVVENGWALLGYTLTPIIEEFKP